MIDIFELADRRPPLADLYGLTYPMFALDTKQYDPYVFHRVVKGLPVNIRITPPMDASGKSHGRATIDDKDFLIYAITLTVQQMKQASEKWEQPRDLIFKLSDFYTFCGLEPYPSPNKINLTSAALYRLKGTMYETNLETSLAISEPFSMLYHYNMVLADGKGRRDYLVTLALGGWLHGAIVATKPSMLLSVSKRYFALSPFRKKVYEVCRKFCGSQNYWQPSLKTFTEYIGSQRPPRQVKSHLLKIVAAQVSSNCKKKEQTPLPDYWINIVGTKKHEKVLVGRLRDVEHAKAAIARTARKKTPP